MNISISNMIIEERKASNVYSSIRSAENSIAVRNNELLNCQTALNDANVKKMYAMNVNVNNAINSQSEADVDLYYVLQLGAYS
jgi:hypothetical protein